MEQTALRLEDGDLGMLVALVQNAPEGAEVRITIPDNAATTLTPQAHVLDAGGNEIASDTVQIRGAGGGEIKLDRLRYTCFTPPEPTFCPVDAVSGNNGTVLTAAPPEGRLPLTLVGDVVSSD